MKEKKEQQEEQPTCQCGRGKYCKDCDVKEELRKIITDSLIRNRPSDIVIMEAITESDIDDKIADFISQNFISRGDLEKRLKEIITSKEWLNLDKIRLAIFIKKSLTSLLK